MLAPAFEFVGLLLAALLVGAMFAVCLLFNPAGLDASTYVTHQQWGIHALHPKIPLLGALTVIAILMAAFLSRDDHSRVAMLLLAAGFFVVAGLITRFSNLPMNAVVATWSAQAPPADWAQMRDAWWRWHVLRFTAGGAGLCLLILVALRQRTSF